MDGWRVPLCDHQHPEQYSSAHLYGCYRHHFASHYASWLTPTGWPPRWHLWSGPSTLETGIVTGFSDPWLLWFMDFFLQGVIWISLATIAEVPPAVCSLQSERHFLSVHIFSIDLPFFEFDW